jgi:uncharacterized protein YpuA (DUF1002 family)
MTTFSTIDIVLLAGIFVIAWWSLMQSPVSGSDSLSMDRARVNTDESLSMLQAFRRDGVENSTDSIAEMKDEAFNTAVRSADEAADIAEHALETQLIELGNQVSRLTELRQSMESTDSADMSEFKNDLDEVINAFTDASTRIESSTGMLQAQLMRVDGLLIELAHEVESTSELAEKASTVVGLA